MLTEVVLTFGPQILTHIKTQDGDGEVSQCLSKGVLDILRIFRGQETPGEDPFHLSSYVNSLITGLQGGKDPAIKKVVSTCKHVAAYDLESWNGNFRYQFDAQVSSQDLVEYYLPAFKQCADSNVGAMMCSYNAVNGVPSCADDYLLNIILREHWGWSQEDQWITSDCDAVQNIFMPHNYTATREEAVAAALLAGTDVNCGTYYQTNLPTAYAQGLFNESDVDRALIRQYSSLVKLGYFDSPSATPYRALSWSDISTPAAEQLAYTAAVEGITLLKNDGTLPLSITPDMIIALLGDWANATTQMQGNYYGPAPYLHSPLYAAQQLPNVTVLYGTGPGQGSPTTDSWMAPLDAANAADVVIYAGGLDIGVEAEGMDRYNLDWQGGQIDLINQVAAMGKPTILLQMGDQLDDTPFINNPNVSAIVWGGYPGQDGGRALIDIVIGVQAPAGRLPVTQYPQDYVIQVPMTDMTLRPGPTNPGRTYKWYNGTAVFPFGYGLHYTNFSISTANNSLQSTYSIQNLISNCNASASSAISSAPLTPSLLACPFATLPVSVANTGSVTSDFVVLAFVAGTYGPAPHPLKQLVAYDRLHNVTAGATQIASLGMTLNSLVRVDEKGNSVLYPGSYEILLDVPTQATVNFTLTGTEEILDLWPQPPAERGTRKG